MKVLIYIRKVLFLFLCGALSFSYGYGQELPLLPDTIKPLLSDSNLIDELITVGYATGNRSTLSGSVNRVNEGGMNEGLISTPLDALRGRVSGVSIPVGGNSAAALAAVRVRGTTSLTGGNDPLVIIDGVFADLNLLSSIYPADIENFTILKDASETAQYGSRGASGVIEVTTKKGRQGAFSISYDGSFGVEAAYKSLDMLSANGFRKLAEERNIGILDLGNNTDFQDEITRLGLVQNHHIAFGGGSETSSYRASLGFVEREGVIRNTNSRNFTTKLNITQHAFNDLLVFDLGIFGSLLKNAYLNDVQKMFYSAATFNPTFPNHKNMETGSWDQITNASQITNPLAWLEVKDDDSNAHINTHLKLVFNLSKHLMFTAFGSYTYNVIDNAQYLPTSVWAHGQAYRGERKTESLLGDFMLAYKKDFGLHQLNVLGLAEAQKMITRGFYTTATNFSTDRFGYDNLQAGAVRLWEGTGSYYEAPHLASFLGRVNYIYDGKYIATVNARADASSKVGANNKWGFFPSASVAWSASEEECLAGNKVITNLKVRGSFGVTGNQEIGNYKSLAQLKVDNYIYNDTEIQGFYETIGNPDLKWERANQFDIGIDLSLWNRLHITADYYYRKTSDLLYQVPIPSTSGFSSMLSNVGSVLNKGYELSITGNIVNTNDFKIDATINLSRNINKVKELYNNVESITLSSGLGLSRYLKVGESLNSRYALLSDGIIRTEEQLKKYRKIEGTAKLGDEMYKDLDGDNQITAKDQVNIGTTDPKLIYGIGLNVQYKKFSLNILGNGAHDFVGGTSYLQIAENQINSSVICMPSLYAYERMWSESNPSGTYPAPGASNVHESDRINSGWNYFVVKSIDLSYDFGKKPIKGIKGIKSLSATVNFQNFITFSNQRGYNPENGDIKYPWVKIVNIGVNAKF